MLTESENRRKRWMSVLAKGPGDRLRDLSAGLDETALPEAVPLRGPETGMVMVRGRAGGTGEPFNMGEMTVTRCSVRLPDGAMGHAYVAGRDAAHALLAARLDAALQNPAHADQIEKSVVAPLEADQRDRRDRRGREAAATKVEFFTLVRGED